MVGICWSKFWAAATVVAAIACVSPAVGSAAGEPGKGGYGAFRLEASNGYQMTVLAGSRREDGKGRVYIYVGGRDGVASYSAPATVTATRIHADLGTLGLIDLEFKPSGRRSVARSECDPEFSVPYEPGSYEGTLAFRGEEGYTEASATKVDLWIDPFVDTGCYVIGEGELFGYGIKGARLRVLTRLPLGGLALQANQNRPGAPVRLTASIEEKRGSIEISRHVGATYPGSAFRFDPKLRSAVLRPSDPFSGSATFRRSARRENRWTGSLEVDFPGHSNVSFTGDRFHVGLLHATYSSEITGPEHQRPTLSAWPSTKPSPLAFATLSPLALR